MKLVKSIFYKDLFSFIIISLLTLITLFSIIFFFDNYNLVAFSDHDEGYLLEQLILKLDHFNIERVQSIEAAYGIEFYYLKYFFNFLGYFINLKEIDIFYILLVVHSFFALGSFYIIFKIFYLLKINRIFNIIFLITILSIPEIFNNSLSLKPDLNLLFFCLSCVLYYFIKFNLYDYKKDYYLLILFMSLSLSIKVWSLPFLVIFFFISYNYNDDLKKYKYIFLFLLITFLFFINQFFLDFKNFLVNDKELLVFISSNKLSLLFINYFNKFFYLILILINIFLIIPALKLSYSKKKNFIFSFYLFFILWFIIISPFIFDFTTFFKTFYAHAYSTHLGFFNPNLAPYENPIVIFFRDLLDFKINPLILILLISSPLIIFKLKKKIIFNNKIINFLLILSISLFLFKYLLTSYPNQFPIKYLYFIYVTIFIFYLLDKMILYNKSFFLLIYLLIFTNFICFVKNFNQYNYTLNYFSLKHLHQEMLESHLKKYFNNISTLFICGGPYPSNFKKNELLVNFIRASNCLDEKFFMRLNKKDLIIINSVNTNQVFLKKYFIIDRINVQKVGRFGKIDTAELFFLKKI